MSNEYSKVGNGTSRCDLIYGYIDSYGAIHTHQVTLKDTVTGHQYFFPEMSRLAVKFTYYLGKIDYSFSYTQPNDQERFDVEYKIQEVIFKRKETRTGIS
jgi:hypothetical protein